MESKQQDKISMVEYSLALELIAKKLERLESRGGNYSQTPRYKELRRKQESIYDKLRRYKQQNTKGGAKDYEMGEDR